jgi:hypothetical protein
VPDDLTALARRLDAVERNQTDHAKSITAFFDETSHLEAFAKRLSALSDETVKMLADLRDEEVKTLEEVARMGDERRELLFEGLELTKSIRRTGRFMKWLALGLVGIFLVFNQLSDQIGRFIALFQGAPK